MAPCRQVLRAAVRRLLLLMLMPYLLMSQRWCGRPACLPAHQSVCPHVHPARPADTHLHFLLEYCNGGELYALLNSQPK